MKEKKLEDKVTYPTKELNVSGTQADPVLIVIVKTNSVNRTKWMKTSYCIEMDSITVKCNSLLQACVYSVENEGGLHLVESRSIWVDQMIPPWQCYVHVKVVCTWTCVSPLTCSDTGEQYSPSLCCHATSSSGCWISMACSVSHHHSGWGRRW